MSVKRIDHFWALYLSAAVMNHVQPTVLLLSSKVDEEVDEYLNPESARRGSVNEDGKLPASHLSNR